MNKTNSYQLRPHVYAVKQHRTVDDGMLNRMVERRIIPVLDMFSDNPLMDSNPEILLSRPEVMELSHMKVNQLEKALDALTNLAGIDWVVMPVKSKDQVLFAQVKNYQYIRYQAHLHIKHFIKFGESFVIDIIDLPTNLLDAINKADTLDELPNDIYSYIQTNKPAHASLSETEASEEGVDDEPIDKELEVIEMEQFINDINTENIVEKIPKTTVGIYTAHDSLASNSKRIDDIDKYQKLHPSILALQDYLRTNMKDIQEFHSDICDIAFRGLWHDDTVVSVQSFGLSDSRGHSAWYINIIISDI